jgi:hypothetical protein
LCLSIFEIEWKYKLEEILEKRLFSEENMLIGKLFEK